MSKLFYGILILGFLFGASIVMAKAPKKTQKKDVKIMEHITPQAAQELINKNKNNPNFQILDVRTEREFQAGHIEGSLLMDYYKPDFTAKLKQLDRDKVYLFYCRSGNRSGRAMALAENLDFDTVYNMKFGFNGWAKMGFPFIR